MSRSHKKEDSRRRLLEAAANCFSEKGFSACSVGEIAKRAGMSHGSVYVHFVDKQSLILTLVENEYQSAIEVFENMRDVADLDGIFDRLNECIRSVGFPIDHRLWMNILAEATRDRALGELQRRLDRRMRAALANALLPFALSGAESKRMEAMTIQIYANIDGLIARQAVDSEFDIEDQLPIFRKQVEQLLRAD
ncbi:TetR/AcrR family transcriptional regulator [Salinicola rhizosphaerae]|uniref:TetR family transcriptional regulator n=1 Tax=Salinicola rhizosphaerae TaxID=1443141 RepID=A0ABQ3EDJ5_9GAMM|nr:TetR/AcrR family transcriptional regulator [Salinicola rhizosphaerae]GHB34603.1 TetR family transcriptional regulator [Salinicola rhizosphaerae]